MESMVTLWNAAQGGRPIHAKVRRTSDGGFSLMVDAPVDPLPIYDAMLAEGWADPLPELEVGA